MKKFLSLFIAVTLVSASASLAMETKAKQAFMVDMATHSVLYNKNGDEQMHPSSMSKLMTLYVLFDRLKSGRVKLDSKFPVSEKAWRTQGSKTFVALGSEVMVEDLIRGIVIQSGNDACIVVAEGISGSEEAFAKEMNAVAKKLGMNSSHFVNATGLPDEGHLMSPRDLATLAEHLITDFPEYYPYFAELEYTYNNIKQYNRNRLLGTLGVDGLKTGHTEVAGYGITLAAKQDGRRLILVINGLNSDNERVKEGDLLLRYGFREFENKTLVRKGQQVAEADIWFGRQAKVGLVADEDVVITLPVNAASTASFVLKYNGPVPAPIEQGAHIADLVVTFKGGDAQTIPLKAAQPVEKLSGFGHMAAVIKHYVFSKQE